MRINGRSDRRTGLDHYWVHPHRVSTLSLFEAAKQNCKFLVPDSSTSDSRLIQRFTKDFNLIKEFQILVTSKNRII